MWVKSIAVLNKKAWGKASRAEETGSAKALRSYQVRESWQMEGQAVQGFRA